MERILVPSDQKQRQFRTLQNQHGTFMYHHKDLFLLDFISELQKINLKVLRLDFRNMEIKPDFICILTEKQSITFVMMQKKP